MAEQTFKSPGFFEREIDLTQRSGQIEGIPAGIIGTATQGPAFVPVTLGSFVDFERKFGTLKKDQFGPFAVREWLKNRSAITYIRVLGAGANSTITDINVTRTQGTVKNAGFVIEGSETPTANDLREQGTVQFIAAQHSTNTYESTGYPLFSDSESFDTTSDIKIVRAMLLLASGAKFEILDHDQYYSLTNVSNDVGKVKSYSSQEDDGTFKLVLSSAAGPDFSNNEGNPGVKIYTASLNPTSKFYIGKFLNTNPGLFSQEQHLLYAEFPVEDEIARVSATGQGTVAILSGTDGTSAASGDTTLTFRKLFGRFNTRYRAAKTTSFISQPFGNKEYDLFHFESLDDGEIGNKRVKISISNLKKSSNLKDPYPTFNVLVRDYNDNDFNTKILERFGPCSLNPSSENYIANVIGDYKVYFNFDAETDSERRLNVEGKRPNKSQYVRVVMSDDVERKMIPAESLPFGFRGIPTLKFNDNLAEGDGILSQGTLRQRISCNTGSLGVEGEHPSGSIQPPLPFRFKTTRGAVNKNPTYVGDPGSLELSDSRLYWGVKFEKVPLTGSISDSVLQSNASQDKNKLIDAYTTFIGIDKLDAVVTGSGADSFNSNKFTLAKVALSDSLPLTSTIEGNLATTITRTPEAHIREAAYIRNGVLETKNYTILDGSTQRVTFATLAASTDERIFNKFVDYAKFTNVLYGGFDGLNILDNDQRLMNDRASSTEAGGKAAGGTISHINLNSNSSPGVSTDNNIVNSYRTAARIITDPFASRVNIVSVPGIRESIVTDQVSDLTKEYSKAMYVMDIPTYDDDGVRIFGTNKRPNVRKTIETFEGRRLDNNYVATYFPDVVFNDEINRTAVNAPASVAALKALGYNDAVAFPWFAPAGFNRGALDNVLNSSVRLNTADRDLLYEARINPIASFPNGGFVIFGQKTLQLDRSSLDRVNVRRMLLEVKRIVSDSANQLIFEQNTPQTRARFIATVTPQLASVQANQGIERFEVIMDNSNNTQEDIEQNRLNGRIVLVPTRVAEFIAIDFIVTNSGVSFE